MIGLVSYVMSCLCFCLLIKVKTTWCEKVDRRTFICTHSLKTNVRKLFVLFLSTNVNISVTVWVKIWIFRDLLQWQHALNLVWTPQVCVRQSSTKLLDFVPHKCLTWLRSGVSEDSADVSMFWRCVQSPMMLRVFHFLPESSHFQFITRCARQYHWFPSWTPPFLTPSDVLHLHFSVRPPEDTRVKLLIPLCRSDSPLCPV